MKKLISLWLFLATLFLLLEAVEGQITFQKIFGPGTAYSIKQTSDNNLIVAGGPMFLLKMGQSGNVIWNKSYATTAGSADASSVAETADGGYIVCGTLNPGSPTSKVVLFKTDSDGNSQWANTYGGSKYEFGNGVIQTFDGGYIIIGSTKSFGTNFDDIYVIKTDSDGNLEWSKNIADTPVDDIDFGTSIVQAPDSGYVICGRIYNASNNSGDVGLIKLDASGNLLWSQSYGGTGDDRAYSIALTSDGGFALSGWTNSFGAGGWDNYVLKTDALGSINWSKAFGGAGNDFSYNISTTSSGGFVLTGTYDNLSAADVFLTEIDSMGDTLWTKNYGDNGSQGDVGFCSVKKGNSFFSVGQSNSFGGIYLIKTDSLGNNSRKNSLYSKSKQSINYCRNSFNYCYNPVFHNISNGNGGQRY